MTRRAWLRLGLAALATLPAGRRARAAPVAGRLYIQPLGGELPGEDVELVRTALGALIGLEVHLLPRARLPAAAFYPPRRRYRAERLLDFLDGRLPRDGARIL